MKNTYQFSAYDFRFIDSYRFLSSSLVWLVKTFVNNSLTLNKTLKKKKMIGMIIC